MKNVCMYETGTTATASTVVDDGSVGYWLGAKRARGSHDGTCMYDQWKWVDSYGRALSTISGLTAFIPGKPDKYAIALPVETSGPILLYNLLNQWVNNSIGS